LATGSTVLGRGREGIFFLFVPAFRPVLRPGQPPIRWIPGALSLGLKRLRGETDHSCPSSAEVKNAWSYTSTTKFVFMAWYLVKHRNNFTFTLTIVNESKIILLAV